MATKRKLSPKRGAASARMTLEDLHQLLLGCGERESLARNYGSVEAARERLDMFERTGQWHRKPGSLPPFVFWVSEPDVPEELCQDTDLYIDLTANRDEPWPENAIAAEDALEVLQWRWLAETGRVTDDDRCEIARRAAQRAWDQQCRQIAESVGVAQTRTEEGQHD